MNATISVRSYEAGQDQKLEGKRKWGKSQRKYRKGG